MNNKILLSIAIPTYNGAHFLENLLNNILPQARESKERIEVCISNNGSTDNTREVVMKFKEKYPDLIKYNENKKNLGVDVNILKVVEMCDGDFIWTLGDDDNIISDGVKEVIDFIENNDAKNIGLIILKQKSYFIDKKTGKETVFFSSLEEQKPKIFKIDRQDIIGMNPLNTSRFMSVIIFNNHFLKKILEEEKKIIKDAIGTAYMHMFLYRLMFLKFPDINAISFNQQIVRQELPYYKFFIEDEFRLHYVYQKKINNLLYSSQYADKVTRDLFIRDGWKMRREFIFDMLKMRAFKTFNYSSYFGCLRLFFRHSTLIDALLFSLLFLILPIIPPVLLKNAIKVCLKIRFGKEWKLRWIGYDTIFSKGSKGTQRLVEQPLDED